MLHQNRTRSTPHVVGQWAAHIYLECECRLCPASCVPLTEPAPLVVPSAALLCILQEALQLSSDCYDIHSMLDQGGLLHLSLSRPLFLQTSQRSALVESVSLAAGNHSRSVLTLLFPSRQSLTSPRINQL